MGQKMNNSRKLKINLNGTQNASFLHSAQTKSDGYKISLVKTFFYL